ncbi:dipeptidyl peptidase III [Aspergillus alliaceus]|uniref:Dipeptidyl peptidase III n=1 Tax=Petromyces alliaceus TaxID=209559 RepID=A0A5N7BX10_PETAA|nr:dipeptidyl peptidase III [Aspergillus alliaceus]
MASEAPSLCHAATYQLLIKDVFDGLSQREKLYAHHLSQAAWHGTRILLRQTSPEGNGIFDFIIELHKACQGQWTMFVERFGISVEELEEFLDFAGMFMSNLNNFCGGGDQKIIPNLSADSLRKMATISPVARAALEKVIEPMLSTLPNTLKLRHSMYYLGNDSFTGSEIAAISRVLQKHCVAPENTRIRKTTRGNSTVYDILQASVQSNAALADQLKGSAAPIEVLQHGGWVRGLNNATIRLERGDHSKELAQICEHLTKAIRFSANEEQARYLIDYIESFITGSFRAFRRCLKRWVKDYSPRVESIFGFIEPYRDPSGVRCEWRGAVSIADPQQTAKLMAMVNSSTKFIRTLPWAVPGVNNGKGPFEQSEFLAPNFSIVHVLAFVCSDAWETSDIPNYHYIRMNSEFKNIVYANRIITDTHPNRALYWIHPSEVQEFKKINHIVRFMVTSIRELLGHGSGKLLEERSSGVYNFNLAHPPISTLTGKPVESWYQLGQTPKNVFGDLVITINECRAMLISYYLGEDRDMLSLFGYDEGSDMADELIYNMYLHIGVEGIRALQAFDVEEQAWNSPYCNAKYAIFKYLLLEAVGLFSVSCNPATGELYIRVDGSKIASQGKTCIGHMLHRLHVWYCTADVECSKAFYMPLSVVDGDYEVWRQIVASKPEAPWKFVQANTILKDDEKVELRVYEASNEGIIQSFADRNL